MSDAIVKCRLPKLDIESLDVRDLLVGFFYGLNAAALTIARSNGGHAGPIERQVELDAASRGIPDDFPRYATGACHDVGSRCRWLTQNTTMLLPSMR